jgi:hypothetical protein
MTMFMASTMEKKIALFLKLRCAAWRTPFWKQWGGCLILVFQK